MKRKFVSLAALACALACACFMTACGASKRLGKPVEYKSNQSLSSEFSARAESFFASFAAEAYAANKNKDNFSVSPVSAFSSLALAAECASGDTRAEILTSLGITYEQLKADYPVLCNALNDSDEYRGKVLNSCAVVNSVWLDKGLGYKQSCIDALSKYYQSYTYSADFRNDNEAANKAVRAFAKEQTKGLIDRDFGFSVETPFTLINTLYLKALWNVDGSALPFTADKYDFQNADGTTTSVNLLQGNYCHGRVYEGESFVSFYVTALRDYDVKFIVPKDGYSLADVFTAQNIGLVTRAGLHSEYLLYDDENEREYHTRCFFPEFKCKYDDDISGVLKAKFGIRLLFDEARCDLSTISDTPAYCGKIRHATELTVNPTGIEGGNDRIPLSLMSGYEPKYKKVYEDFIVNKAFGFVITGWNDTALYTGVVNKL